MTGETRSLSMAIRKLLLPLTGTAAGEAALSTALMIARIWNAHVTALHVRVDSRDVAPLAGEGLSGAMIEEMMSATEKESIGRAGAAAVAATGGGAQYTLWRRISAARAGRAGSGRVYGAARRDRRDRVVPPGQPGGRGGAAERGARIRLRPAGDGRLFALPPAPADSGRRDATCAGARRYSGADEPLAGWFGTVPHDGAAVRR